MSLLRNTFLMKRLFFAVLIAFVYAGVSADICPAQEEKKEPVTYTQKDRDEGVKYFLETQEKFINRVSGLSDEQMSFKPNEKSWTVAEVAEHIVLSESAIMNLIQSTALKSDMNKDPGVFRVRDIAVRLAVTNRGQKFNAPPVVQPKSEINTVEGLISGFKTARAANIEILKNTTADLRNHFTDNPLIGVIDAYQWFLFLNGHTERHLAQMDEIMADKNYPAN